jgi:hypothetical protein
VVARMRSCRRPSRRVPREASRPETPIFDWNTHLRDDGHEG